MDDATAERVRAFVQDDAGEAVPLVLAWGEALGRPLVWLVDDVNRRSEADRWLPLLRRHASPRLALVVAGRQRGAEVDLLELPLGRLAAPAAVARALGVADPALAEAIGQRSGGLPSLAVAVARELARTDALVAGPRGLVPARGAHVALPAEVEREIQRRIPIGEADRSALEVLAMCGRAATEAIWQEACGARGVAWSTDLAESLRRAGMVVGQAEPRMADDLVQGMLLEEITEAGEGTGLATVVADVLERRPASPARNERLGELSLLAGRWARAAILLFGAAVQVELRDRPERSHLLLDQASRALDQMPDGPVVAELRAGIGLWRAGLWANEGDPAPALASLEGLRPLRGGYVAWRLTLLEAELRLRLGLVAGALEAARRAVDTASPDDERTADLLGEVLLHLNRPEETLAVIPPTGFAHPHRVGAHLALGDLDGAERELASPRPPDASWAAALHHAELETALRRGEPVWERLQVDWADPEWLDHPQHRAKLVILLSLAAVREHPDALGTLEAELREQLAVCGTRNGTFGRMIGEVADRIGPPLAERFRDLAASQEPIDLG